MFIEDDKLPDDVLRKRYSVTRHALCCLERGWSLSLFHKSSRRCYSEAQPVRISQ
jgi:hypothetical protein